MKLNVLLISLCVLSALPLASQATSTVPVTDTLCCAPQNLTLVSGNATQFCVSWSFPAGGTCTTPYGFLVQWSAMPTTFNKG